MANELSKDAMLALTFLARAGYPTEVTCQILELLKRWESARTPGAAEYSNVLLRELMAERH